MKEQLQPKRIKRLAFGLAAAVSSVSLVGCDSDKPSTSTVLPGGTNTELPVNSLPGQTSPEGEANGAAISISGVPEQVSSSNLDIAKGTFANTIGLGTESFLAEPGSLLVGPDYQFDNPDMTLKDIDNMVNDSHGHIEYINPVNQQVFETEGTSFFDLPEGGYVGVSAGEMTLRVKDFELNLPGREGHNYLVFIRGTHADGIQDSDLNSTIEFSNYVAGHIMVERYPAGDAGFTGGFVSEGQFKQMAKTSYTGQTNCGAEGCSELTSVFLDVNTGAFSFIASMDGGATWTQLATNIVA